MPRQRHLWLLAYSGWDAIPVICAILQGAYLLTLLLIFPRTPHALGFLDPDLHERSPAAPPSPPPDAGLNPAGG